MIRAAYLAQRVLGRCGKDIDSSIEAPVAGHLYPHRSILT